MRICDVELLASPIKNNCLNIFVNSHPILRQLLLEDKPSPGVLTLLSEISSLPSSILVVWNKIKIPPQEGAKDKTFRDRHTALLCAVSKNPSIFKNGCLFWYTHQHLPYRL